MNCLGTLAWEMSGSVQSAMVAVVVFPRSEFERRLDTPLRSLNISYWLQAEVLASLKGIVGTS